MYNAPVGLRGSALTRIQEMKPNLSDLDRSLDVAVDNTGNVCVWPAEQVLAYYLASHAAEYRCDSACEVQPMLTTQCTCLFKFVCTAWSWRQRPCCPDHGASRTCTPYRGMVKCNSCNPAEAQLTILSPR